MRRRRDGQQRRAQSENLLKTLGSNCIQEGEPNFVAISSPTPATLLSFVDPTHSAVGLISAAASFRLPASQRL
jgi:hypothetical protein